MNRVNFSLRSVFRSAFGGFCLLDFTPSHVEAEEKGRLTKGKAELDLSALNAVC